MTAMLEKALALAADGMPVFPCRSDKRPLTAHGFKDATTDQAQVRQWWSEWPHALPGVPTGEPSGLFVLDVDRRPGADGFETLEANSWSINGTRAHRTQSGGMHYLFRYPKDGGLGISAGKLGPGLDTRGDGGYVIWWPAKGLDVSNPDSLDALPAWIGTALGSSAREDRPAPAEGASVAAGGRNDHLFRVAAGLHGKGLSANAIEAALLAENAVRCSPPLDGDEVRRIARSTHRYPEGTEWRPSSNGTVGFRFVAARELLAKPKPIRWLIGGLMESGTLAQIFGQSGCGKSFIALDWSASVATGAQWYGRETAQGAVFYIAGEGHAGLSRRLRAWEIHHGIALADAPLFVSAAPAALMDAGNSFAVAEAVEALAAEYGTPAMIVVDTLARNLGNGDESSNADLGVFINNIDIMLRARFGAAVVIVHHSGWQETQRSRGGSALRAAMDHEFRMAATDMGAELSATKMKESELPEPMHFEIFRVPLDGWTDDDGEVMTSAVLRPVGYEAKPVRQRRPAGGNQKIILDALREHLAAVSPFGLNGAPEAIPSGQSACQLEDVIDSLASRLTCEPRRQTERARLALTGLVSSGHVVCREGWLWLAL